MNSRNAKRTASLCCFKHGRELTLVLAALCLPSCGFVLAPIEAVTVGTLRGVVNEFDRQMGLGNQNQPLIEETQAMSAKPIAINSAGEQNSQKETPADAIAAPAHLPILAEPEPISGTEITRISIMPDNTGLLEN